MAFHRLIYDQDGTSVREGRVPFPQSLNDQDDGLDAQYGSNPTSVSLPDPPADSASGPSGGGTLERQTLLRQPQYTYHGDHNKDSE